MSFQSSIILILKYPQQKIMINQKLKTIKLNKKSNSLSHVLQSIKLWVFSTCRLKSYDQNVESQFVAQQIDQQSQTQQIKNRKTDKKKLQQRINLVGQMINVDSVELQKKLSIKFSLQNLLQKIPVIFVQKVVAYTVLQKLGWTISEQLMSNYTEQSRKTVSQKVRFLMYSLSAQIKQFYQQICLKNSDYWKQKFHFNLLCMLITKIISSYIQENIKQILIQKKLMSEIYIIVVHVFLGFQVSAQTYTIIANKFIKKQAICKTSKTLLKATQSFQFLSKKFCNNQKNVINQGLVNKKTTQNNLSFASYKKLGFVNNSQGKQKRLLAKNSYQQQILYRQRTKKQSFFNSIQQKDDKRLFIDDLKSNLYVAPLPPVVKQKMNINQIDKKQQTFSKKCMKDFDLQDKKKHMKSNQLSLSMNAYLKKSAQNSKLRNSQLEFGSNQTKKTTKLQNNYLPIKGINLRMKSQKSSAHYFVSQNNSFQQKKTQKNSRQLQSQRIYFQLKKQSQFKTQKATVDKKRKNLNQWNKIIDQLRERQSKKDLNICTYHYPSKIQSSCILIKDMDIGVIAGQTKNNPKVQKLPASQIIDSNVLQTNQKDSSINITIDQPRTSTSFEAMLKYASSLKKQQGKEANLQSHLQVVKKDYSSLQHRINESSYKQNIQNRQLNSFGLKKSLNLFAENCKKRNQYIVSSIFKKNNIPSYD